MLTLGYMLLESEGSTGPYAYSEAKIFTLQAKLLEFENITGRLPTKEEGLQVLVVRPDDYPKGEKWAQLLKGLPNDAWGKPFYYVLGEEFEKGYGIYSMGPDGVSSTEGNDPDDRNSWRESDYEYPE